MSLFMPRTPSGKAITHSPACSRSTQFLRVPTTDPVRTMATLIQGTVGSQYSPIPRMMRGGSASRTMAAPIIAASIATWPAWFAIRSTRPCGTRSMPCVSTRNQ
jgi:hypothetical protein